MRVESLVGDMDRKNRQREQEIKFKELLLEMQELKMN